MTLTLLKNEDYYLSNEEGEVLKSPVIDQSDTGVYIVEEDEQPIYDPETQEVFLILKDQ